MRQFAQKARETDVVANGVGTLLCATRMRMGKDLQHIAEILHIRYNYLVAMEDGRYEDLPGQAYAIGFVRAYADHLGLDGDEVVRRYKEESSGLKNRPVFEFPLATPDSGVPSGALILIAVLFGMVVYGVWYAVAGSDRSAVQVIQEVPDRLTAMLKPPPPPAPVEDQQFTEFGHSDLDRDPIPPENLAPDSSASDAPGPLPADTPAAQVPEPPQVATPAVIDIVELRAKSDVWITLRSQENPERTQLLHKGEVFRAPEGGGGMTLVTGKPTDLEILLNGQVMPPLDEGTFARGVPLDPAHLKGAGSAAPVPAKTGN
jgi:cytoskeletal protein RodZ